MRKHKDLRLAAYGEVSVRARGAALLAHAVWVAGRHRVSSQGGDEVQSALALREWVDWRAMVEWLRGLVFRQPQHGPIYIGRSSIPVPFQDVRASPLFNLPTLRQDQRMLLVTPANLHCYDGRPGCAHHARPPAVLSSTLQKTHRALCPWLVEGLRVRSQGRASM